MQDGTFTAPGHPAETTPTLAGDAFAAECPTRRLLDRIADKWSVLILLLLGDDAMRFNQLKRRIGGISQKMLSQTLRSLERDGIVLRTVEPTMPVRVTYAITPLGRDLLGALRAMIVWAETRIPEVVAHQHAFDARMAGDGPADAV